MKYVSSTVIDGEYHRAITDLRCIGEDNYFTASGAKATFREGLEHEFHGYSVNNGGLSDGVYEDALEQVEWFNSSIGKALNFVYDSSTISVILGPPPGGLLYDEYSYRWKLEDAWATPGWRWEWLFWRDVGLVELPMKYDLFQCDDMELFMNSIGHVEHLSIQNVTIGAYLDTEYSEDARIYRPCRNWQRCRVINNGIFCRGGMLRWNQIYPLLALAVPVCFVTLCLYPFFVQPVVAIALKQYKCWQDGNDGTEHIELVRTGTSTSIQETM